MQQKNSGCAAMGCLFSIIICVALVINAAIPAIMKAKENARWRKANEGRYQQAVELYRQGKYEQADEIFGKLDYNYSHVKEYSTLCDAHRYFDKGDMNMAKFSLDWYSYSFLPGDAKKDLETFRSTVERGYAAYKANEEREDRRKLEERIRTEPPFLGMDESRINDYLEFDFHLQTKNYHSKILHYQYY